MIGKNLPLRSRFLPLGRPCPLGLATGLTGLFLGTVGYLFLMLLPSLRSDMAGIVHGVELGVFSGRLFERDAHIGSKIILSLFRQQSTRESTGLCSDNIVLCALCIFGHELFEFDDAIEEGTVRRDDDATAQWD